MAEYTTYIEVEVTVHYDFSPEQEEILYPNDSAQPGYPAVVDINAVEIDHLDIYDSLDGGQQQELIDEIMEHLTTGDR